MAPTFTHRTRPRSWGVLRHAVGALTLLVLTLAGSGCLNTLPHDRMAEMTVLAPRAALSPPSPSLTSRPYWLLRDQTGWCGAHEASYTWPHATAVVRVALFEDASDAAAAFSHLSPAYVQRLYSQRIGEEPRPAAVSLFLPGPDVPGENVRVAEYLAPVPPPFRTGSNITALPVLVVSLWTGRAVLLLESLGLPSDDVSQLVAEIARASEDVGGQGC